MHKKSPSELPLAASTPELPVSWESPREELPDSGASPREELPDSGARPREELWANEPAAVELLELPVQSSAIRHVPIPESSRTG